MENLNCSFGEIYKENYDRIFSFLYNITTNWSLAEDITQEAFLRAYINIDSFRNESRISVWLNKIAYNLFIDHKRKKTANLVPTDDDILMRLADLKKNLPRETEQKVMSQCIQNKIFLIPENYRIPLLLDAHGYSNKEKAIILGCSLENVKIRLHRARKKIKEILGKECVFYHDERNVLC